MKVDLAPVPVLFFSNRTPQTRTSCCLVLSLELVSLLELLKFWNHLLELLLSLEDYDGGSLLANPSSVKGEKLPLRGGELEGIIKPLLPRNIPSLFWLEMATIKATWFGGGKKSIVVFKKSLLITIHMRYLGVRRGTEFLPALSPVSLSLINSLVDQIS